MKIKEIRLKNFRGFKNITIPFPDQRIVVLIGKNGAGKSSVLDAIVKLLSEFSYRFNNAKQRQHIEVADVLAGETDAECSLTLSVADAELNWTFKRKAEPHSKGSVNYSPNESGFIEQMENQFGKLSGDSKKPLFLSFDAHYQADIKNFLEWYKELVLFVSFLKNNDAEHVSHSIAIKEAVEQAIAFTGISIDVQITENFKSIQPVFSKNNNQLLFSHLSDGEKRIIDIIGKIVSHFGVSFKEGLLNFEGIVLIDEIEKHLHPQWQRDILSHLHTIFPKLQFIISTHSSAAVSNISHQCIVYLEDFSIREPVPHTLGRDVNSILYDVFQVTKRSKEFEEKINAIYHWIDDRNFEKALSELEVLKAAMGESDIEIKRIEMHIELMD